MAARYSASRNQYVDGGADVTALLVNGAIAIDGGVKAITKASVGAFTLAPPTAGDAGTTITIVARTAFAHTVTITEGLGGRGAGRTVMTFAAVGDAITLLADNLHWIATSIEGVVVS